MEMLFVKIGSFSLTTHVYDPENTLSISIFLLPLCSLVVRKSGG